VDGAGAPPLNRSVRLLSMEAASYGIVYKVTNAINGKVYIGQTIQSFSSRIKDHRNCQDRLGHLALYRAFRKYGFENFVFEVICHAQNKEALDAMEKMYIQRFRAMNPRFGYNMTYGGEGGKHPPEIRIKISSSLKGRIHSEQSRRKLSQALKGKYTGEQSSWWGRKHTEEEKKKIGSAQVGELNHNFGKKASAETRAKMSESRSGEKHWNHKKVKCVETGVVYISSIDAFNKTGIDNSSIGKCCKGKRKKAGGFTWVYVVEDHDL